MGTWVVSGLCWDNGKENGSYYLGFGDLGFRVSGSILLGETMVPNIE